MLAIGGLLWWTLGAGGPGKAGSRRPLGATAWAQGPGVAERFAGEADEESGLFLPTDRLRERQLDQARQAIAAGGFSDASTVIDDILASDADSFLKSPQERATWTSVKAEAGSLLDGMPAAGRDAYELQFRARAQRQLQQALASDDREAVVAVARRWFHTPAGKSAAVMTALDCLATGQPLSALAWLDRLASRDEADRFEPSLSLMRAVAAHDAGDLEAAEAMIAEAGRRAGGTPLQLGGKPLKYLLEHRQIAEGSPSQSIDRELSRPLLVSRFRVPLTRHPGESRLLVRQRLAARDRQRPLLPAGQPLVIGDTVVLRSPLGLLGVDLTTGKRIWLQPGRFDDDSGLASIGETGEGGGGEQTVARGYEDLTTGTLASNGRLLFAVDSPASATSAIEQQRIVRPFGMNGSMFSGNSLSAYDPAGKGQLVWRLPQSPADDGDDSGRAMQPRQQADGGSPWYLGPPLSVGNELYVLVEELGEIRLDVLDASRGDRLWSQPLAELDEDRRIEQPGSRSRRLAGLAPALDDGVLVCPTGAGGVVGLDAATRTLLWAYRYDARLQEDVVRLPNGMIIRRGGPVMAEIDVADRRRWLDSTPVMADGRVFLSPMESDELHCLDARSGSLLWKVPRGDGLMIAGVDGHQLVVVGTEGVAAYATADGTLAWPDRFSYDTVRSGAMPSGRGLLGKGRLLLPVDAPAVLEIDLRDCSLLGVSAGGDAIPGNLLACRGEMLSQAIDSLDVFYQAEPLRHALAEVAEAGDGQPVGLLLPMLQGGLVNFWKGQLLIDAGRPREGAELIAAAGAEDPDRVTPRMVADAMLQALRLDFQASSPFFATALAACPDRAVATEMLRVGIDGFLSLDDPSAAWQLWRQAAERCLAGESTSGASSAETGAVPDGSDPLLASTPSRWLAGRLEAVLERGSAAINAEVDQFISDQVVRASEQGPAEMATLVDLVAAHHGAQGVRERFVAMLADPPPGQEPVSVGSQKDRLLQLEMTQMLMADQAGGGQQLQVDDPAWPVGRVDVTSAAPQGRRGEAPPLASLPITGQPGLPFPEGLRLKLDRRQPGMFLHDGFGRQFGGLLSYEGSSQTRRLGIQAVVLPGATLQATIVGRVLLIASASGTAAFELDLPERDDDDVGLLQHRRLWHAGDAGGASSLIGQGGTSQARPRLPHLGGSIPLGTAVSEPRAPGGSTPPSIRGTTILPNGAVVLQNRTLAMHHPISGAVLWSRSMLPSAAEILTDTSCVCVCSADGGLARVYSMHDGRDVGQCDLPPVAEWLETCGRLVLAIQRGRLGQFTGGSVHLELIDPLTQETVRFGPFAAETRAVSAGPGRVALLEPDGRLTVLNLRSREADFEVTLERMPSGFNQLSIMPWRDRLLVIAGRPETAAENEQHRQLGVITGVRTAGLWDAGQQIAPLVTGAVWAVDRGTGDRLWSVPATILHHGFDPEQPSDLPVLVFARRIKSPGSTRQPQLSLLCLDKRTGCEVLADDRIATDQHLFYGCEIEASPRDHTVTLSHGARDITLTFGGEAMSPQPPYQGLSRPLKPPSLSDKIEELFEQALEALPF